MSQLAAQLRILAGAGGGTTSRAPAGSGGAALARPTLAALSAGAPGSTASSYRASFLFAADVAAATDTATVASMGASGLEQLAKLEPRFRPLVTALAAAGGFDRDAHTQAQMAHVQAQVNQCIALLAPFFMIKPTHKVLEFLIRRYSVHIYNINALLAAFLPYHESALFARLLQVLQLHISVPAVSVGGANAEPDTHKLFGFLEAAQREGTASITRHTLVQRCMTEPAFLRWLVGLVALKPQGQGHSVQYLSNTTITFYTTLMLELLSTLRGHNNANHSEAKDQIARTIVQHALEVLSAHVNASQPQATTPVAAGAKTPAAPVAPPRELVFSALLLLSQAALVHQFGASLDITLFLLLKSVPSARGEQTLAHPVCMALLALTQNQHVASAPPKGVTALVASQGAEAGSPLVSSLANLSQQYDTARLLHVLLPQLATAHVGEQRKQAQLLLSEIVQSLPLGDAQVHTLVSSLLHAYVDAHNAAGSTEWVSKELSALRKLVLLVQERYSVALESVVQRLLQEAAQTAAAASEATADADGDASMEETNGKKHKSKKHSLKSSPLLALVHLLFEGSAHEVLVGVKGGTDASGAPHAASILTCLQSPLAHVRIQALQAVDNLDASALGGSGDVTLATHLHSALLSKLADADAAVVRATLRLKALSTLVPFADLVQALGAILARFAGHIDAAHLSYQSGAKVLEAALKLAAKLAQHVWSDAHASSQQQGAQLHALLHTIFPFLFELSLARPSVGVTSKLTRAAHSLMALLATKAQLAPRHAHHAEDSEQEEENGFLLCALFAQTPAAGAGDAELDAAAIRAHNAALLSSWTTNFVTAVSAGAHGAVEAAVMNALVRVAAAVTAASRASNKVGGVRCNAPSTAFALLQMLNQAVQQLAGNKKSDAALFLRVTRELHRVLASVWSSFTSEQRRAATASESTTSAVSALVSPVSFVSSASGAAMTPASFPAFVRSSLANLVSVVDQFVSTHGAAAQEGATTFLRELYGFFVADAESVSAFGAHIALLCKTHLHGGGLQETVRFLLPVLQGSGAGTASSLQVSVRSFHLLHALLQSHAAGIGNKGKSSKEDGAVLAELGASFLFACASPSRAVRHAAIMAVPALVAAIGAAPAGSDKKTGGAGALVAQLLQALNQERIELLSASSGDAARVEELSLRESATDASLQFMQAFMLKTLGTNAAAGVLKSDAQRAELQRFLTGIALRFAATPGSVWSGWRLLQLLRRLPHERVAELTLPHLSSVLDAPVRKAALTSVAVELVEQLDASVLKADTDAAFRCLMQALSLTAGAAAADAEDAPTGSTRRAVAAIQTAALSRVSADSFALLSGEQQEQLFDALLRLNSSGVSSVGALVAQLPFDSAVFAKRLTLGGGKKKKSTSSASELAAVQVVLELLQLKDPHQSLRNPFALLSPLFSLLEHLTAQGREVASSAGAESSSRVQSFEYAKQLTMSALNRFLDNAAVFAEAGGKKNKGAASGFNVKDINVDAVVACLGASGAEVAAAAAADSEASAPALNVSVENTRTHALTLLSLIGQAHPELLVGVLIPIFQMLLASSSGEEGAAAAATAVSTAMQVDGESASAANAEEPYALRLLNRLISTVLPSIVRAQLQWNTWQLLGVFVDSLGAQASTTPGLPKGTMRLKKKSNEAVASAGLVNKRRLHLFHNLLTSLQAPAEADGEAGASSSHLHVVVSLLLAKSVTEKASAKSSASDATSATAAALVEFAHVLCEQFDTEPGVQIRAFNSLLQLLGADIAAEHADLLAASEKPAGAALRLGGKATKAQKATAVADVSSLSALLRTSAHRRSWQKAVLSFLSQHLARLTFAQQIYLHAKRTQQEAGAEGDAGADNPIQTSFLHLFEQLFARLRSSLQLNKQLSHDEEQSALAAHFLLLSTHTKQALLHLNGLLTMANFVRILQELFRISAGEGKRDVPLLLQALSLLHSKLLSYKDRAKIHAFAGGKQRKIEDEDEPALDADVDMADPHSVERAAYYRSRKAEQRLLVSLLPALQQLLDVEDASTNAEGAAQLRADEASMKQSVLLNLDILASSFGHMRQFQTEFVSLVPAILRLTTLPKLAGPDDSKGREEIQSLLHSTAWQHVSTSALLCLATLVSSFQNKAHVLLLEFVPTLVPNTLAILQHINATPVKSKSSSVESAAKGRKRKHGDYDDDDEKEEEEESTVVTVGARTLSSLVAPLLQLSALSVLQACIVSVPELLSPYLADLLKVLLFPAYHNGAGGASSIALLAANATTNATSVAAAANASAAAASASASVDHASVSSVVSQSLSALVSKVSSRTLLPYLFNHYKVASSQGYASLRRLFQLLSLVVGTLQSEAVKQHFKLIFKFFLAAAQQLRKGQVGSGVSVAASTKDSARPDASGASLSQAEDALIGAFLELTMKLNETSFKGLFLKLLQWVGPIPTGADGVAVGEASVVGGAQSTPEFLARSMVFFKLIHQLTLRLKGIFVTYFGYILDHCVLFLAPPLSKAQRKEREVANKAAAMEESDDDEEEEGDEDEEDEDGGHARKKQRKSESASAAAAAAGSGLGGRNTKSSSLAAAGLTGGVPSELVDLVLLSLRNCFLHDSHHFMDKYHWAMLTPPMVAQLAHAYTTRAHGGGKGSNEEYDEFIGSTLTPTIVQMAIRMGNYLQWKPLISALLAHGRSPVAAVRRASVHVLLALVLGVGDNLLVILPELMPWMAEMQEDGDAGVERMVAKLVRTIEKMTGEPLDASLHGE